MRNIFHIDENNNAIQLSETAYEKEEDLQKLIAEHPGLLAGEQIDPENPRRWILIAREMGVPGHEGGADQWFLDHLFIDQDGIPTFVEVKRSTDTRIRREVVAQMLDYAANATAYWPVARLQQAFEAQSQDLCDCLDMTEEEAEDFWEKVDTNLHLGKLRLLFVADRIPDSLQRIIEFLNNQMTHTEVLGLEVKQYISEAKQKTLVPKLIGKTATAVQVKKAQNFTWTEDAYLDQVEKISGNSGRKVCENLLRDFQNLGCHIRWGKGLVQGGFTPTYRCRKTIHRICAVYFHKHDTTIEMPFSEYKAPFDHGEIKEALITKLNAIEGCNIPVNPIRPSFNCTLLHEENSYNRFVEICKEMIEKIQEYEK